ncbi:MAG: response regulator transcription factor [Actinomycetota bacterium]|nr:response regulator transcription factor [Actinomycetota bacterium]
MSTPVSGSITAVVVDDQALVRAGFRMILDAEDDIDVIGEAADGREAIDAARRLRPDVVLMDIRMPNVDGVEATRVIAATADAPTVLILTTFDLDEYVYAALRAGASGFLLKDTPADDLAAAVRVLARGDALIAPSITRRLLAEFMAAGPPEPGTDRAALERLTERETEVLTLMARGLSNGEIADELILGEATIKTHVSRVLMKLGARDRVQAVIAAYETGLVTPGQ